MSKLWLFLNLLLGLVPAHASVEASETLKSLQYNNEGVKKIEQNDELAAEQSLLKAMAEDPSNPIPHLNLGWVYEASKNYEKAIKEYESVLRYQSLPEDLKFIAHFNAGNAHAQNENIEQALLHYQAALTVRPDSVEVKTNIELLFKGGSGKGKGKSKDKSKNQDDQNSQDGQGKGEPKEQEKPQFKNEKLTKEDVRKILEELKAQEQKIRALEYGSKTKEKPPEKDW